MGAGLGSLCTLRCSMTALGHSDGTHCSRLSSQQVLSSQRCTLWFNAPTEKVLRSLGCSSLHSITQCPKIRGAGDWAGGISALQTLLQENTRENGPCKVASTALSPNPESTKLPRKLPSSLHHCRVSRPYGNAFCLNDRRLYGVRVSLRAFV